MNPYPKPVADVGDAIADAMLDMIDQEEPLLRQALYAAIKQGAYVSAREPGDPANATDGGREVVRFPQLGREYVIPLVRVGGRRSDA
jgi:hypothetical protein